MKEIIFHIEQDIDGGYVASAELDKGAIVTQGDDINELKMMIQDAIDGYFYDKPNQKPQNVILHFEEILAIA